MATANICDACGDTIHEQSPRTVLTVDTAVGTKHAPEIDQDCTIDVCDKCRATNPGAVVETITRLVTMLRNRAGSTLRKRP